MVLTKALTEAERLTRLLTRQEATVRAAFALFLKETKSPAVIRQVRELLERGRIEDALVIADSHVTRLSSVFPAVFAAVGSDEVRRIAAGLDTSLSRVALSFDVTNPRAAALMRRNRLSFIQGFARQQRSVTRDALVTALRTGGSVRAAAEAFRDSIGLTPSQYNAVNNYRNLLLAGSREALDRALRDRRFDPSVSAAAAGGDPLSLTQINRMVGAYQERMLRLRADTIARTETIGVLNQARQEAIRQTNELANFEPGRIVRTWRSTQDARTRDTHAAMNGQERGLEEPFVSPSGARLMYPGDPDAPASERINCRCVVLTEFR